jgi:hypothetical protein
MRRFVVSCTIGAAIALAAAACAAKSTGGQGGTNPINSSPTASGPAPTGTASAPPTVTPTTGGPTGPPPPTTPAHTLKPNKSGYVWGYDSSSSSYTATGSYWYNSAGSPISITHSSPGQYTVRFQGLGDTGGVAHASAYGNNSNFCTVVRWLVSGSDETVDIACFTATTAFVDTTFVANFEVGSADGVSFSYLWANQPTLTTQYNPPSQYRYDSTGQASWVQRQSTGKYRVYLPASYDTGGDPITFQVTAYGLLTARCAISGITVHPGIHEVTCLDATGAPFDTKFEITMSAAGSFIGRTDLRFGDYRRASSGVVHNSTGVYTVPADGLGSVPGRGQVTVTAIGTSTSYCHVGNWSTAGLVENMVVRCFNPAGSPVDSDFTLGVTW